MLARVRISSIAAAATAGELGMLEVVVWRIARGTGRSSRPESDGCFAYIARLAMAMVQHAVRVWREWIASRRERQRPRKYYVGEWSKRTN